MFYNSISAWYY